ncbi:MAG TPA: alpha-amylase/4-alpha-glucanotransferase domain-containing protein [Rhodocyclaceae bacterium]|nr:alpha-amylase/4-alpha-glucanotransferase domain-containing protein [Rhodocyclaceae bacterium]
MTQPVTLLFGVHAHQPVGNFPEVIEEAHVRCYRKFFQVVERYPEFRFSAHFSGWLLDVLRSRWPEDMERVAAMTRRGQVEWFGSGDCEPVLAAIPHRDRVSQINALSDKIETYFGQRPRGAWLTERVWESSVVASLADTGIRYAAVDDYHFLCAGEAAGRLDGYFATEDDDRRLDLFPISEQARYRLPFSPAREAVAWLEQLAREGRRAAVYFDDIEKFGIWPETYEWVYERGWLAQFIEGVLTSPLVRTATYAEFHDAEPSRGVVYLPTTSYIEMNEWTLPAPAARAYHQLVEQEKQAGRFEGRKPYLRGGIWRNFFMRYPESNWMHKRMLEASRRLAALPPALSTPEMQEHLHRAQANDAYWHGLFGGLYLPHLRRAVWNNLLALEAQLDRLAPPPAMDRRDLDLDGAEEIFLNDSGIQAVIRADGDAMVVELADHLLGHNFGDTLRRFDEGYHDKLAAAQQAAAGHAGIASAHDRIAFRHAIDPAEAEPDSRARGLFEDCWAPPDGSVRPLHSYRETAPGVFVDDLGPGRVEKRYALENGRLVARYRAEGLAGRLEIRLNVAMPSCDGYAGRYILEDGHVPCGFGQAMKLSSARSLTLDDGVLKGGLAVGCEPALAISARPHYTVSQSEAGFEKVMQAAELTLLWPLAPEGAELVVALECRHHGA